MPPPSSWEWKRRPPKALNSRTAASRPINCPPEISPVQKHAPTYLGCFTEGCFTEMPQTRLWAGG